MIKVHIHAEWYKFQEDKDFELSYEMFKIFIMTHAINCMGGVKIDASICNFNLYHIMVSIEHDYKKLCSFCQQYDRKEKEG